METLAQRLFWQQQQLCGAVAFIVVTILSVVLKLSATAIRVRKRIQLRGADIWQDVLLVSSLFAIIAMCACALVNSKAYEAWYNSQTKAEKSVVRRPVQQAR